MVGSTRNCKRREKKYLKQNLHILQLLKPPAASLGKTFTELAPTSVHLNRRAFVHLISNAFPTINCRSSRCVICPRALNLSCVKPETKSSTVHFILQVKQDNTAKDFMTIMSTSLASTQSAAAAWQPAPNYGPTAPHQSAAAGSTHTSCHQEKTFSICHPHLVFMGISSTLTGRNTEKVLLNFYFWLCCHRTKSKP